MTLRVDQNSFFIQYKIKNVYANNILADIIIIIIIQIQKEYVSKLFHSLSSVLWPLLGPYRPILVQ
jgi:hypothetical protein